MTTAVMVKDEGSSQPMCATFLYQERSNCQRKIPDPNHQHLRQSELAEHHQELGPASVQTEVPAHRTRPSIYWAHGYGYSFPKSVGWALEVWRLAAETTKDY